jgi:PAS domain S-box-containing protein
LVDADQLLHDILDAASAVIYVKDIRGRYLFINRQFEKIFQLPIAGIKGKDDLFLFGPEIGANLQRNDREVISRNEPIEVEESVMHPMGMHTYHSTKFPLYDREGNLYAICGISTDISDRKQAEVQLRESEARYRLLAENSFDLISRHAPDATYLYLSPVCESFLGYRPEELVGTSPFDLIHPEDAEPVRRLQQELVEQPLTRSAVTCRLRRKDGTYIWSESSLRIIRDPVTQEVVEAINICRDITERKRAEAAMGHATRLASIGTLAAGIAHEINNPIGAAWTSAEAALAVKDDPEAGELLEECLRNVIQSVKRCGDIVRNVLKFSKHEVLEKLPTDLNDTVRRAHDATRTYADALGARIEMQLAPQLPLAAMNALEMEQVVVNLLRNAIESGERVKVIAQTSQTDKDVCLRIIDDGRGLSEIEQERIWEPFYTLRADRGGTGLGLSIVFGIVQDSGGYLQTESTPGNGTTMSVYLPIASQGEPDRTRQSSSSLPSTSPGSYP